MSIKSVKITAFILEDKVDNLYTVFMEGDGGPIISDKDRETALTKFERALHMACAVKNVITLQKAMKSTNEQKRAYAESTSSIVTKTNIEYINVGV